MKLKSYDFLSKRILTRLIWILNLIAITVAFGINYETRKIGKQIEETIRWVAEVPTTTLPA